MNSVASLRLQAVGKRCSSTTLHSLVPTSGQRFLPQTLPRAFDVPATTFVTILVTRCKRGSRCAFLACNHPHWTHGQTKTLSFHVASRRGLNRQAAMKMNRQGAG